MPAQLLALEYAAVIADISGLSRCGIMICVPVDDFIEKIVNVIDVPLCSGKDAQYEYQRD